jgi:hypothetical protein
MAAMGAAEHEIASLRIASGSGVPAEYGATIGAGDPLSAEHGVAIRTEPAIQLAWVDAVETALRQLAHRNPDDRVLADAVALTTRLRAVITGSGPSDKPSAALWLCLYCCLSMPFLNHFSSAVGDDLGHAMAHQIVQVLSSVVHRLEF